MESIITKIVVKYVQEYMNIFTEHAENMPEMMEKYRKAAQNMAVEVFESAAKQLDRMIYEDKTGRKEKGLLVQAKDQQKAVLTAIGPVQLERTSYRNKETGEYERPLDELLGLERHQRTSLEVMKELVTEASRESYSRSSEHVTGGELSRQSVYNAVRRLHLPDGTIPEAAEKRVTSVLHVFADEDHVHMQKPQKTAGKRCQNTPLVTVTEGIRDVSKGRRQTIRTVSFVDDRFDTKRLWDTVEGYLYATYDMTQIEKVYVYGDGANWIRNGLSEMEKVVHVIDGFHWEKRLRGAARISGIANFAQIVRGNLRKNKYDEMRNRLLLIYDGLDEERKKEFDPFCTYLLNNWDAIRCYETDDSVIGSCTEALVSHILSERFSRNPMGWSKENLGKLSWVRVFLLNGNEITEACFRKEAQESHTYADYLKEMQEAWLKGANDWSIFDPVKESFDQNSGTQTLVRHYGQIKMNYIN